MSTITIRKSEATPEFLAGVPESMNVIIADDTAPALLPAPAIAFTPSDEHVKVYKGWITPREAYALLHPIAKKGSCTAKAVFNSLPVTGTVSVASLKKGWRGAFERGGVERISERKQGDKVVSSVYAQRTNSNGKSKDGRAPEFFKAGGAVVVDEVARTASLRLPNGYAFSDEQVVALTEAIG